MPFVLTQDAQVTCGPAGTPAAPLHGGAVVTTFGTKLTIKGHAVRLASAGGSYSLQPLTCKNPIPPANPSGKKCTSISGAAAGAAKKLTVGGVSVLLASVSGQGTSDGSPVGVVSATASQAKLSAS